MADYNIRRTDRVFFVGSTGSGKTTLAKALLWGKRYLVVLDPKHQFTLPDEWKYGYVITSSLNEAKAIEDERTIIYRPSFEEARGRCEDFFQWIFERENVTVYVDEVFPIVPNNRIGYWFGRCIVEGRAKGVSVWSATQRPASIPLTLMTESEHFFVFRLANPDDRKRMGDWGNPKLGLPVRPGDTNGFYYFDVRTGKVRYWKQAKVGKMLL